VCELVRCLNAPIGDILGALTCLKSNFHQELHRSLSFEQDPFEATALVFGFYATALVYYAYFVVGGKPVLMADPAASAQDYCICSAIDPTLYAQGGGTPLCGTLLCLWGATGRHAHLAPRLQRPSTASTFPFLSLGVWTQTYLDHHAQGYWNPIAYVALVLCEADMNMMGHCGYRQPFWLSFIQVAVAGGFKGGRGGQLLLCGMCVEQQGGGPPTRISCTYATQGCHCCCCCCCCSKGHRRRLVAAQLADAHWHDSPAMCAHTPLSSHTLITAAGCIWQKIKKIKKIKKIRKMRAQTWGICLTPGVAHSKTHYIHHLDPRYNRALYFSWCVAAGCCCWLQSMPARAGNEARQSQWLCDAALSGVVGSREVSLKRCFIHGHCRRLILPSCTQVGPRGRHV